MKELRIPRKKPIDCCGGIFHFGSRINFYMHKYYRNFKKETICFQIELNNTIDHYNIYFIDYHKLD